MDPTHFGAEQVTEEDRGYRGSRFSEVRDALFANPYQKVWGGAGEPPLPTYDVSLLNVLRGVLPLGPPYFFRQAVARAVDARSDLRWGPDLKGFRRIIHPNGICLTGLWEISEQTAYSGYFRKDSRALVVGRYSTCCKETRRGRERSLSLVEAILFGLTDKEPTQRQLYQIAELGKPDGEPTRAPAFMRLLVDPGQPRIPGEALDFRDEVMAHIYDRGDPAPKRTLTFDIEVTDEGSTHGPAFFQRRRFANWRRIGRLVFSEAVASYNGDCVIHFNHPTWRDDRNDPSTATRVNERKVG
jgi:hypothetical protein